ncbi:MAG: hypothetical protein MUC49_02130 [Raineya sp.]|nr:hypothetical protein [Raineya sp.]
MFFRVKKGTLQEEIIPVDDIAGVKRSSVDGSCLIARKSTSIHSLVEASIEKVALYLPNLVDIEEEQEEVSNQEETIEEVKEEPKKEIEEIKEESLSQDQPKEEVDTEKPAITEELKEVVDFKEVESTDTTNETNQ